MFDHVEFSISSFKRSRNFYFPCLEILGYKLLISDSKNKILGFGLSHADFLIYEDKVIEPKMHIAFSAQTQDAVNSFHEAGIKNGGLCNGKPGLRENYSPNYYAAFLIDPDGHNIEAVFRGENFN